MAATLAAAIFGSGRDLVCSPVSSPREAHKKGGSGEYGFEMAYTGLVRALVLYNAIKNLIRIGTFFLSPPFDPSTRWRPSPAPW